MTQQTNSQKVTITDIAKETGVSPAAVSLALRNKPGVSHETRQHILLTAETMGYPLETKMPPPTQNNVNAIGLIVRVQPNDEVPMRNSFYGPVLSGIEEFCRQNHINLFYAHMPVDEDNTPVEPPRLLQEQSVDGLLFIGAVLNKQTIHMLQKQNIPIVLVDAYAQSGTYDAIVSDNEAGAYQATQHLIAQGHKHIALVGSLPDSYPSILERRKGYLKAITEHALSPHFVDCHHYAEEAIPAMSDYLQKGGEEVTAVFATNDEVAIGVMQVAQSHGLKVPQDLSIVGFDNINVAKHMAPPLSTMRVDKMGMGRLAAQTLLNRISYPQMGQIQITIRPSLMNRQSVHLIKEQ